MSDEAQIELLTQIRDMLKRAELRDEDRARLPLRVTIDASKINGLTDAEARVIRQSLARLRRRGDGGFRAVG